MHESDFSDQQIKKDFERIKKRGKDLSKLKEVVSVIAQSEVLEERHRDHSLLHGSVTHQMRPNKTDAGNGSYGIYRVIDGCQRLPGRPLRVAFIKRCRSAPFPPAVT